MLKNRKIIPVAQALLAAALFGASAPVSKLLLSEIEPIPLAALLYLGSGIAALLLLGFQSGKSRWGVLALPEEAPVNRDDLPWLAGALLAGGVVAPIILLFSLRETPASTASLLLNFEVAATTVIAALIFREAIGRRVWTAIGSITLAAIILSWGGGNWGFSLSAVGVLMACALWGLDNNFTRNISAKNPLTIVMVKGFGAGSFSLMLALLLGDDLPGWRVALQAMFLGSLSYGLSIMLFILAMRGLGTARSSALFGTAPFIGSLLSVVILREVPGSRFALAFLVAAAGAVLLLKENHKHTHEHHPWVHDHRHGHADHHHDHAHQDLNLVGEHSHLHRHGKITHVHSHAPDLHHWHAHPE